MTPEEALEHFEAAAHERDALAGLSGGRTEVAAFTLRALVERHGRGTKARVLEYGGTLISVTKTPPHTVLMVPLETPTDDT